MNTLHLLLLFQIRLDNLETCLQPVRSSDRSDFFLMMSPSSQISAMNLVSAVLIFTIEMMARTTKIRVVTNLNDPLITKQTEAYSLIFVVMRLCFNKNQQEVERSMYRHTKKEKCLP